MPRGRPKKIIQTTEDAIIPAFTTIDQSKCFQCGREVGTNPHTKGERNEYKFCSIECFNKD